VNDPYLWLEDVSGKKALDWVRKINAESTKQLEASPDFEPLRKRLLAILESKEQIPYVSKHGKLYYNFWRDDKHVRGSGAAPRLRNSKRQNLRGSRLSIWTNLPPRKRKTGSGMGRQSLNLSMIAVLSNSRVAALMPVWCASSICSKEFVKDASICLKQKQYCLA